MTCPSTPRAVRCVTGASRVEFAVRVIHCSNTRCLAGPDDQSLRAVGGAVSLCTVPYSAVDTARLPTVQWL